MAQGVVVRECFEQKPRFDSLGEDMQRLRDALVTLVAQCKRHYWRTPEKNMREHFNVQCQLERMRYAIDSRWDCAQTALISSLVAFDTF